MPVAYTTDVVPVAKSSIPSSYMKIVVDTLKEKGLRDQITVLVGGAPVNEEFAKSIGADAYCRDAAIAVETAKDWIKRKHNQRGASA